MKNPYTNFIEITPDDDTDIHPNIQAIYIGTPGDLVVIDADGETVTLTVTAGDIILPIRPKRILESTDITNIVGLL